MMRVSQRVQEFHMSKRVAIITVVGVLALIALALYLFAAPKIDCSPPQPDRPTVSVPSARVDDGGAPIDVSIQGEIVDVTSSHDSYVFTVRDEARGLVTLKARLGESVALDVVVGRTVSVDYVRWFGTGSSGYSLEIGDKEGLVFAVEEGGGNSTAHTPFVVNNVSGGCPGSGPAVPSVLNFSAGGTEVAAATGESATLSVKGRDYLLLTTEATEIVDFDVYDLGPEASYVIARIPREPTPIDPVS